MLIFDDYHEIREPVLHAAVNFLLVHLPKFLHLIILTRADPPLALGRLRMRDQLVELRSADLCFLQDEATEFLNTVMELDLSQSEVALLEERTEGWVAGLQLAALSLQHNQDSSNSSALSERIAAFH